MNVKYFLASFLLIASLGICNQTEASSSFATFSSPLSPVSCQAVAANSVDSCLNFTETLTRLSQDKVFLSGSFYAGLIEANINVNDVRIGSGVKLGEVIFRTRDQCNIAARLVNALNTSFVQFMPKCDFVWNALGQIYRLTTSMVILRPAEVTPQPGSSNLSSSAGTSQITQTRILAEKWFDYTTSKVSECAELVDTLTRLSTGMVALTASCRAETVDHWRSHYRYVFRPLITVYEARLDRKIDLGFVNFRNRNKCLETLGKISLMSTREVQFMPKCESADYGFSFNLTGSVILR